MGEYVGEIGQYEVRWDSETGAVWVGGELCDNEADSEDGAMEVAQEWVDGGFMSSFYG